MDPALALEPLNSLVQGTGVGAGQQHVNRNRLFLNADRGRMGCWDYAQFLANDFENLVGQSRRSRPESERLRERKLRSVRSHSVKRIDRAAPLIKLLILVTHDDARASVTF